MKDVSTIIIAEAGVNHNGSIPLAKKLIDIAADAGADYVKFQTFKAENLVSKYVDKAEYQKKSSGGDDSQFEMIKKLELDQNAHEVLIAYCKEKKIQFLSTAFDHRSIDMLEKFDIPFYLNGSQKVHLIIYDVKGRIVDTLLKQELMPGTYKVKWYAKHHASGMYFAQLRYGDMIKNQKVIFLK